MSCQVTIKLILDQSNAMNQNGTYFWIGSARGRYRYQRLFTVVEKQINAVGAS